MITNDFKELAPNYSPKAEEKAKDAIFNASGHIYYTILGVGEKIHNYQKMNGYAAHMMRTMEVKNADPERSKYNKLMKGEPDIKALLERYNSNVAHVRKNNVLARDMLISASPEFFKKYPGEVERYFSKASEFLEMTFKDNYLFSVLHMDEHSPHLHVLVGVKFWSEKKQEWILNNNVYFDGKVKLIELHDKFGSHMHDLYPEVQRPPKGGRATQLEVEKFYGIITTPSVELSHEDALKKLMFQDQQLRKLERKNKYSDMMLQKMAEDISKMTDARDMILERAERLERTLELVKTEYGITDKKIERLNSLDQQLSKKA